MTEPRRIALFRIEMVMPEGTDLFTCREFLRRAIMSEIPFMAKTGLTPADVHVGGGRVLIEGLAKRKGHKDESPPLPPEGSS